MKINIRHKKENIMEALQVTRDRMDEIVESSRQKMIEKHPEGTKSQMLESMIGECRDVTEVVATTIVWQAITGQMETQKKFEELKKVAEHRAFREKISISKNDNGTDKGAGLHLP